MKNRTTITDIARELGVTPATVSRALNDHSDVSSKMKKRILETAEQMDYHRNKLASSLRSGKTQLIGVLIPSADHNFFGSVIHGIVNMADQHGYDVLIHQSNESHTFEARGVNAFLSARVDGILASLARDTIDYRHFSRAVEKHTPVVFFDRVAEDIGMGKVVIDDYKGAFQASSHLITQGYKRIAHISGPQHIKAFNDRLKGYMAALQAHGLAFDPSLIYQGDISIEAGRAGAASFLGLENPPDAIFAVDDFAAIGVLKTLKEKQIKVPEAFGLAGFCNDLCGQHTSPSLTTIDQQTVKMGEEAFNMLYSIITHNGSDREELKNKVVLEPKLLIRESSGGNA